MAKPTLTALKQDVRRLLELRAAKEEYEALEAAVKAQMVKLGRVGEEKAVETDNGRVFVAATVKTAIPVPLASEILGIELATKVIQVKTSVSNDQVKALVKAQLISPEQAAQLDAGATKTPGVSIYVRPLQ